MSYQEPYFFIKDSEINLPALFEKFENNHFTSTITMKKYDMKREYMYMANEIITRRFELKVAEHKCTIYNMLVELISVLSEKEKASVQTMINSCDKLTSYEELKDHVVETRELFSSFLATSVHNFVEQKLFFLANSDVLKEGIPNEQFNDISLKLSRLASQKNFSNINTTRDLRTYTRWLKSIFEVKQIKSNAKKELSFNSYDFFLKNIMDLFYLKPDELGKWKPIIVEIQNKPNR